MPSAAEFLAILQYSPQLFGDLIRRQNRTDTTELRQKVLSFLGRMARHPKYLHVDSIPHRRLVRYAVQVGLCATDTDFLLRLHEDYFSGSYHAGHGYSEDDLRRCLSSCGSNPIEWWFLIAGELRLWCPQDAEFHFIHILDGDGRHLAAIEAYLRANGSAFNSVADARLEAARRGLIR